MKTNLLINRCGTLALALSLALLSCKKAGPPTGAAPVPAPATAVTEMEGAWHLVGHAGERATVVLDGFRVEVTTTPQDTIRVDIHGSVPVWGPIRKTGTDYIFEPRQDWFVCVNSKPGGNTLFYSNSLASGWINKVEFNKEAIGHAATLKPEAAANARAAIRANLADKLPSMEPAAASAGSTGCQLSFISGFRDHEVTVSSGSTKVFQGRITSREELDDYYDLDFRHRDKEEVLVEIPHLQFRQTVSCGSVFLNTGDRIIVLTREEYLRTLQ